MKTSKSYLKYVQKIGKNIMALLEISPRNFQKEDYHKLKAEYNYLLKIDTQIKSTSANLLDDIKDGIPKGV